MIKNGFTAMALWLRRGAAALAAAFLCALYAQPAAAMAVETIQTPKGVHAWFVQDKTVPIVSLRFDFKGGTAQDPADRPGLVNLLSSLLDEGAGDLPSEAFQRQVNMLQADMDFGAGSDAVRGSLQVVGENADKAAGLLALALQKPRFDEKAVNRVREQLIVGIKSAERDPDTIASKKFAAELYGKHPYARPNIGNIAGLEKISRADLAAMQHKIFARDNLTVGIVGPLSKKQAAYLVAKIFDDLPAYADLQKIAPVKPRLGSMTAVHYALPQTSVSLVYPGVARSDKDYYPAALMNYVLGGAGLTSRLFREVREKRGLAYSVNSALILRDYSDSLVVATGTRAEKARRSLETIRAEIKKIAEKGISPEELAKAKSYAIGAFAVQNMQSSMAIASTLVKMQEDRLPKNYMDIRAGEINAVTLAEVNAVAKRLFSVEPAILTVGSVED